MFHIHFELFFFFFSSMAFMGLTPHLTSPDSLLFFESPRWEPGLAGVYIQLFFPLPCRNLSTYLPGIYSRTWLSTFKERACEICPYIQKRKQSLYPRYEACHIALLILSPCGAGNRHWSYRVKFQPIYFTTQLLESWSLLLSTVFFFLFSFYANFLPLDTVCRTL